MKISVFSFWSSLFFELANLMLMPVEPATQRCKQVDRERGTNQNQSRGIQLIHAKRLTHHPNTRYTLLVMDSWLYYIIVYYTINTILCYTILYYTILYYTILYYTILYYTILYYTILYCTVQYCIALHCIALYCTILHYTNTNTILYYIILYY